MTLLSNKTQRNQTQLNQRMVNEDVILSMKPLAMAFLLSFSGLTHAVETPNAGTLQQQIKPTLPAMPSQEGMDLTESSDKGLQDNTPFMVTKINIDGNASIDTATLYELVKSYEGQTKTITEIQQACKSITEYYRAQGYGFARAIIPQQEIENGVVRIQVIEAKYGSININNTSRVNSSLLESTVASLKAGNNIEQKALDRALLLVSDIPGIQANANIRPGKAFGESDIDLDINPAAMLNGRLALDNFGNRFINRPRLGGTLNLNNPLKHGDLLSINYLTTGERMQYAQLSYDWLLNGAGTHVGASYANLYYKLGDNLQRLDINGTSDNTEAWLKHPIIRGRNSNLYANLRYQHNVLRDRTDSANIKNDRTLDNWVLSLNGDLRDSLLGGGVNSYQLSYTQGDVDFDNTNAKGADNVAAKTQGNYTKWNYNLNRLQNVTDRLQLWSSLTGQVAEDNLDPSQKMVFGGPYSVRAYDNGTISGDNGTLMTLEARYLIGQWYGSWQGLAFYDAGSVEVNDKRWPANTGKNKAHLAGAGVGINWFGPSQIQARAFVATSTSDNNSLTKNGDNNIAWVEFAKNF